MQHPYYTEPVVTIDYNFLDLANNTCVIVFNKVLKEGDFVQYPWINVKGQLYTYKKVEQILEQRQSKGEFINFDIPNAFTVVLSKTLYGLNNGVPYPV